MRITPSQGVLHTLKYTFSRCALHLLTPLGNLSAKELGQTYASLAIVILRLAVQANPLAVGSESVSIPDYEQHPLLGKPVSDDPIRSGPIFKASWTHALYCVGLPLYFHVFMRPRDS